MALGKGLGSLIPVRQSNINIQNQIQSSEVNQEKFSENTVEISKIHSNPHQPRRDFNYHELEDLINSIKIHGILQPLIVTVNNGEYELIAGERRLRAAKIAGCKNVPVVIRQASDLEKLELALIENIQRSDLNPIEKAEGYQKLLDEFGLTQDEAAKKVGISRPTFTNTLRLLQLPPEIQKALVDNKISEGHAKIILSLPSPANQANYLHKIIANKLSVHELESSVNSDGVRIKKKAKKLWLDPQIVVYEEELSEILNTKVNIKNKGEQGSIIIEYYSLQELDNIVSKIKK